MMKDRVLVTGGAGFIGSHLTEWLVGRGHPVTVLDNFSTGSPAHLDESSASEGFRLVEGSILDGEAVAEAMRGCSRVYHLAVECVRRSIGEPLNNHEINATGTLRVLEVARKQGIGRFVYCSSSEVYGNSSTGRLDENATLPKPVTVYGAAKLAGELYALAYWQTYGLKTVVVRPFNAYGPREHDRGDLAEVIPRFFIRTLNGLPPIIFGTGDHGRDFTYVTDVARGIGLAGEADALVGGIVNIACGRMVTIRSLAHQVARLAGLKVEPILIEGRPGDVAVLEADTRVARSLLGYEAEIPFHQGLARYFEWYRAHTNDIASLLDPDPRNWTMPAH